MSTDLFHHRPCFAAIIGTRNHRSERQFHADDTKQTAVIQFDDMRLMALFTEHAFRPRHIAEHLPIAAFIRRTRRADFRVATHRPHDAFAGHEPSLAEIQP